MSTTSLPSAPRRARPNRPGRQQAPARANSGKGSQFDRGYWLLHCEGYRVDGADGRIGFVESVRHACGATVLAVRGGWLGRRLLLVPADEVAFIVPRAERIWLTSTSIGR